MFHEGLEVLDKLVCPMVKIGVIDINSGQYREDIFGSVLVFMLGVGVVDDLVNEVFAAHYILTVGSHDYNVGIW